MKIAFDYQTFTHQPYGGVSRYFVRLAQGLVQEEQDIQIFAPLHRNQYLNELPENIVHGKKLSKYPPKSKPLFLEWNRYASHAAVCKWNPEVIHETYYAKKPVGSKKAIRVITVYDMIHELFPNNFSFLDKTTKLKKTALARADKIICISHSTRNDLMERFNLPEERVSVVHLGFEKFHSTKNKHTLQPEKPYLLYVGNRSGYKNFNRFIEVFSSSEPLKNDFRVIAFGGGAFSKKELDLFQCLGLKPDQIQQMSGSDDILGQLYENARAFIYPSLYEGFGLPPLESMAHGCPVISSNSSSMPEVIGDAGVYFSPSDFNEMKHALENTIYSDTIIKGLIQKGFERLHRFSWKKCAQETLQIYSSTNNG
jgi:glycosyltransferase involved in cell wall biosynthesis